MNSTNFTAMSRRLIRINSVLVIFLAGCLFIYPPVRAIMDLKDPALSRPGIPKFTWRLFQNLTPRYTPWAEARVSEGRAERLSINNIPGTEWPLFGSVFYLWGIENLQTAWEGGDHTMAEAPKVFARKGIVAASELVIDPKHATWVKKHWGSDYLHRENVFYRMLVIAALTTRENLLRDGAHLDLLRDQVESFAKELDESKTGLLDDYPGECYPGDVMAALMCIKRADSVLGLDHSQFLNRAVRGFTGARATRHQLPPYAASSGTGMPISESRGCGNSYMCLTAPELWPAQAKRWYSLYDRFFWQQRITAMGYREYPQDVPHSEWTIDVDAGPVIAGHGVSASAFGIGAARKNGRYDRAYPLTVEMLATSGELPNGMLAVPRILSNLSDAPMLGESAILWLTSVQPEKGFAIKSGGNVPMYVYIVLSLIFLFGLWRVLAAVWAFKQVQLLSETDFWLPRFQFGLWLCLMVAASVATVLRHGLFAAAAVVIAIMLPVVKRKKPAKGVEDWPSNKAIVENPSHI
jgi:hypothetical protein